MPHLLMGGFDETALVTDENIELLQRRDRVPIDPSTPQSEPTNGRRTSGGETAPPPTGEGNGGRREIDPIIIDDTFGGIPEPEMLPPEVNGDPVLDEEGLAMTATEASSVCPTCGLPVSPTQASPASLVVGRETSRTAVPTRGLQTPAVVGIAVAVAAVVGLVAFMMR